MNVLNVVCEHCFVTNRVPGARLADAPNCGKCHSPLFTGLPVNVTDSQFHKMITNTDLPVVVDFWASWCGPCKAFAPVYEQAAKQLQPGVRLLKLDTEANQATAAQFQIRSIPTLAMFISGKEKARQSGALPLANFMQWVEQNR